MKRLAEFFQEENGGLSSVRLFNFLIVTSAVVDWQRSIWTTGRWSPEWQVVALVAGVLGLKVWQKSKEPTEPAEPTTSGKE